MKQTEYSNSDRYQVWKKVTTRRAGWDWGAKKCTTIDTFDFDAGTWTSRGYGNDDGERFDITDTHQLEDFHTPEKAADWRQRHGYRRVG